MNTNTVIIDGKNNWKDLKLNETLQYRDTIWIFVKRNFTTRYKQTVLGPTWLLISPIFTVFAYSIVFGGIAGLSTDGVPRPLFYLLGSIVWNLFNGIVTDTANTFTGNVGLFGKIYFPRLIVPISNAITKLIDFFIQFTLFAIIYVYYSISNNIFYANETLLLCPLVLIQFCLLGIGIGIIISSVTTKYRDLMVIVGFGMQIWLYASPVIYSITLIPEKYMFIFMLNPVAPGLMIFKYAFLGVGYIPYAYWGVSWGLTVLVIFVGLVLFNHVERTFMDVI